MLLFESRRAACIYSNGDLALLGDQDRSLWAGNAVERVLLQRHDVENREPDSTTL